jgi:putative spermidine/putrescine transport system permease protein
LTSTSNATGARAPAPGSSAGPLRQLSTLLYRRHRVALWLLLTPPLSWLGVVYLGSLGAMVWQPSNFDIVLRTVAMAAAVTLGSVAIGFPIAYYIARYTTGTLKGVLYASVMLPMWVSYIVKAYAWTVILAQGGLVYWLTDALGLRGLLDTVLELPVIGGSSLSTSSIGRFFVFVYVWLPFMILPIYAAIERVPENLIQASADLGARPAQTFRTVILPLTFPGVVAGSIFTFSLTLGDYIIPQLIGPPGFYIGTMVNTLHGSVGNLPMAAAFTLVPIVIIGVYLALARRLGAFDAL